MASRHAPLGELGSSEFAPQQRPAPRPVLSTIAGVLVPGGGQIANGSLWWGSLVLVAAALTVRLIGQGLVELTVILVGAAAAAMQARLRQGVEPRLPGAGAVLVVAVVPGALFMAALGAVGGLAGVGQFANRTYVRGFFFFAAQFLLSRWSAVAATHWLPLLVLPVLSAVEAAWSAWSETVSS